MQNPFISLIGEKCKCEILQFYQDFAKSVWPMGIVEKIVVSALGSGILH